MHKKNNFIFKFIIVLIKKGLKKHPDLLDMIEMALFNISPNI